MRIFYVLLNPRAASYRLGNMILPQLEANTHGVEVVGFFFFDDNVLILQKGNPIGERLYKIAKEKNMILMMCDSCALERGLISGEPKYCTLDGKPKTEIKESFNINENVFDIVKVGCFPDLYNAIAGKVDMVVTL